MNEKLNLLNLSMVSIDGYIDITPSDKMKGYFYIVSQENYQKLSSIFGAYGESDLAFAEDSREWLVALFDCLTFDDVENMIISYFGSQQKTVEVLGINNLQKTEEISKYASNGKDLDVNNMFVAETQNFETLEEKPTTALDVINYFKDIDNFNIKTCFLSVLSHIALEEGDENIITNMFDSTTDSFLKSYRESPTKLEEFLAHFMIKFEELVREGGNNGF